MIKLLFVVLALLVSLLLSSPSSAYPRCWWDGYRWVCAPHSMYREPDNYSHRPNYEIERHEHTWREREWRHRRWCEYHPWECR